MHLAPEGLLEQTSKLESDFEHELQNKSKLKLITKRAITTHNSWTHNIEDFVAGEREGIYLCDINGKRLINCHSNGGVFNLGHRNPRIIRALQHALEEYDIGNHHLISAPRALLAERLAALSPGDIQRVVFGVSGGEAIDLAIKLARGHTGRAQIISAVGGYHGHTGLALAAGDEAFRKPFEPLSPGF
ncbi:MAG: aminotransferase class III-fold pyridoxal phosphate-dependent enzyme, partial [Anaerolineales bacterium]